MSTPTQPAVQPYATVEQWIKTEWSWVHANIALHPYLSVAAALLAGNLVGLILHV